MDGSDETLTLRYQANEDSAAGVVMANANDNTFVRNEPKLIQGAQDRQTQPGLATEGKVVVQKGDGLNLIALSRVHQENIGNDLSMATRAKDNNTHQR